MKSLTIETPSRLHFGLLGWGPQSYRQFGGFGLMIDDPGIELTVKPSETWEATGDYAGRALEIAKHLASQLNQIQPARLDLKRVPREHVGLGVGTQLSMAVARALTLLYGLDDIPGIELARLCGRGLRSGVGIHGFSHGGLIVDAGRRGDSEIPTLLNAIPFPEEWSILLATPKHDQGLHGMAEIGAFQTLNEMPVTMTERICRLLFLQVLPAVLEKDLDAFGDGLSEIQRFVGEIFSPVQGGSFASPETESRIKAMTNSGLRGVGQSSWGPTLYGFLDDSISSDRTALLNTLQEYPTTKVMQWIWTRANRKGFKFK